MPVIIARAQQELWLQGDVKEAGALLQALAPGKLAFHKVDRRMSSARVDDAQCIAPSADEDSRPEPSPAIISEADRQGRLL